MTSFQKQQKTPEGIIAVTRPQPSVPLQQTVLDPRVVPKTQVLSLKPTNHK